MKYIIDIPEPIECDLCALAQCEDFSDPICSITRRQIPLHGVATWCPLEEVSE